MGEVTPAGPDRERAAQLYAEGRELEARKEYYEACERYEESLRLHHDDEVKAAHMRMLATIGPE